MKTKMIATAILNKSEFIYKVYILTACFILSFMFPIAAFSQTQIIGLTFKAQQQNNQSVLLTWQMFNDQNTNNFIIQHSTNGNQWSEIGTNSARRTSILAPLQYIHEQPENGRNYYRLQQKDNSGRGVFSNVVVLFVDHSLDVFIFPNPAYKELNIQLPVVNRSTVKIYNNKGYLLQNKQYNDRHLSIDIEYLPSGIYFMHVSQQNKNYIRTFLKN